MKGKNKSPLNSTVVSFHPTYNFPLKIAVCVLKKQVGKHTVDMLSVQYVCLN
jgi:hypothetical protein